MYELSVRDAKALPDYSRSDDTNVRLELNGMLIDPALLRMIQNIVHPWGNGSISHEEACRKAVAEFQEYRRREMIQYESDFDRAVRELTEQGTVGNDPLMADYGY